MQPKFAASLMCMDLLHISQQLQILNRHCDLYHADIMDGHFCPNLTLSPDFIRAIRPAAALPIDVHLMVSTPNNYIDALAAAGADILSLHAECINTDAFRTIRRVKEAGCQFGVVLNPATPLCFVESYLDQVDILTIMTVDVGFAGQPFIPQMLDKIAKAQVLREEHGYHYLIQSDGANNAATYQPLYQAGVRSFVMGSSGLFRRDEDLESCCHMMKQEFHEAVGARV
jgi:D-allulose-6-phosphate 3-epimerase